MADAIDRLSKTLAGRYEIERELGAGGMATVYLARDLKHDREVAIKLLRPELAAALGSERFLNEIKITARLDHPHILVLIDSGAADGVPSEKPADAIGALDCGPGARFAERTKQTRPGSMDRWRQDRCDSQSAVVLSAVRPRGGSC